MESWFEKTSLYIKAGFVTVGSDGCILEYSPIAAEILGRENMEGVCFSDLFCPKDQVTKALRPRAGAGLEPEIFIWNPSITENSSRRVRVSLFRRPFQAEWGKHDPIYCLIETLEPDVWRPESMEPLGVIVAGISHTLNNHLTGLLGNVSLAVLEAEGGEIDVECLRETLHGAERMADAIRKLLLFSQQAIPSPENVDLGTSLRFLGPVLQKRFGGRCKIEFSLSSSTLPIRLAPSELEQIVLHLCSNAVEAMPEGGLLRISTALLDSNQNRGKPEIMLCIEDTGPGIPHSVHQQMFEPFFTTKETPHHPGLGLAMVHEMVKRGQGRIRVETEPGEGTRFYVYFPAPKQGSTIQSQPSEEKINDNETILVVDDHEPILRLAQATLEEFGFRVLTAGSGSAAMEMVRSIRPIKAIVLDECMPDISGSNLLPKLSRECPRAKFIVTSGYPLEDDQLELVEKGAHGFMQKPYHMWQLARKIHELLTEEMASG